MGNGNLELIANLIDAHGVRYFSARHESAAVAAGDGYARAGERIGVATVTHGPGLTNALTALVTARRASTPLLLIAGDASGYSGRSTQRLDQKRLAAALDIPFFAPQVGDDWGVATRQATAACREGTVLLNLPAEALSAPASDNMASIALEERARPVDVGLLSQVAEELIAARRPLILAGRGVVRSSTDKAVRELARRTGARLGTSLAAKGLFSGAPADIGMVGGLGSPESTAACRDCDLVLVLGAP
jgi:thiamine pyrophosphate-dependent acetolactate synthase large subunit-like protein